MARFRDTMIGSVLDRIPPVVRGLILTCVVVWILELVGPLGPYLGLLALDEHVFRTGHLWQLLTYQFLHAIDPWHVLFNMWGLWLFGAELERHWGPGRFLRFYLTCGAMAGLLHVVMSWMDPGEQVVVGASGSIFGLMAGYAMTWPHRRMYVIPIPVPIEVRYLVLGYAVLALAMAWSPASRVANFAHLGGAMAGYLYVKLGRAAYRSSFRFPDLSLAAWRRKRRRSRLSVVEKDKEFDRWLRDLDDDLKH